MYVCLEAEALPRGSLDAAKVLLRSRLHILMPRLGLNVMTSKLRYDIIIHNFHPFIFCIYVFKTFEDTTSSMYKQRL